MSGSPPFVTFVAVALTAVLQVVILCVAIANARAAARLRTFQERILADLRQLQQLSRLDRETLAYLQEQDQTITHQVNEGMRRLERELHMHTGSNMLHAGGPDVT